MKEAHLQLLLLPKQAPTEQQALLVLPESESAETIQNSTHDSDAILLLPVVFLLRQRRVGR